MCMLCFELHGLEASDRVCDICFELHNRETLIELSSLHSQNCADVWACLLRIVAVCVVWCVRYQMRILMEQDCGRDGIKSANRTCTSVYLWFRGRQTYPPPYRASLKTAMATHAWRSWCCSVPRPMTARRWCVLASAVFSSEFVCFFNRNVRTLAEHTACLLLHLLTFAHVMTSWFLTQRGPVQKLLCAAVQELSFTGISDVVLNIHPSPFQEPGFVVPSPSVPGVYTAYVPS